MGKTKKIKADELIHDDRNANLHTDEGEQYVAKSLDKNGAGRSVLVDKNGKLIAGNLTVKKAKEAGMSFVEVETDANTIVVVKRPDLDLDDKEDKRARQLAIADNRASEISLNWDYDQLEADAKDYDIDLGEWDIEIPTEDEPEDEKYTKKIEAPIYEPGDWEVDISDLVDREKSEELIERIDKAKVPDDVKAFLRLAAGRHNRFNYEAIADYYASADLEVQRLFEDSALVIIDFGKAIEEGYTRLNDAFREIYLNDYTDEK